MGMRWGEKSPDLYERPGPVQRDPGSAEQVASKLRKAAPSASSPSPTCIEPKLNMSLAGVHITHAKKCPGFLGKKPGRIRLAWGLGEWDAASQTVQILITDGPSHLHHASIIADPAGLFDTIARVLLRRQSNSGHPGDRLEVSDRSCASRINDPETCQRCKAHNDDDLVHCKRLRPPTERAARLQLLVRSITCRTIALSVAISVDCKLFQVAVRTLSSWLTRT